MCAAWGIAMRLFETPSRHTLLYDRAHPRPRLSDRAGVSLCKCYEIVDSMVEATCLGIWEFTTHIIDLCANDEDPSQLIIRPGWDAPHVRCYPRTFYAWPSLLRQVGTVLGSPYDYVVAGLAYANPGSRQVAPTLHRSLSHTRQTCRSCLPIRTSPSPLPGSRCLPRFST